MEELLSVPQAAARRGVWRNTINEAIRSGRLPATRVGRYWALRVEDVDALVIAATPSERASRPRPSRQGIEPKAATEASRRARELRKKGEGDATT